MTTTYNIIGYTKNPKDFAVMMFAESNESDYGEWFNVDKVPCMPTAVAVVAVCHKLISSTPTTLVMRGLTAVARYWDPARLVAGTRLGFQWDGIKMSPKYYGNAVQSPPDFVQVGIYHGGTSSLLSELMFNVPLGDPFKYQPISIMVKSNIEPTPVAHVYGHALGAHYVVPFIPVAPTPADPSHPAGGATDFIPAGGDSSGHTSAAASLPGGHTSADVVKRQFEGGHLRDDATSQHATHKTGVNRDVPGILHITPTAPSTLTLAIPTEPAVTLLTSRPLSSADVSSNTLVTFHSPTPASEIHHSVAVLSNSPSLLVSEMSGAVGSRLSTAVTPAIANSDTSRIKDKLPVLISITDKKESQTASKNDEQNSQLVGDDQTPTIPEIQRIHVIMMDIVVKTKSTVGETLEALKILQFSDKDTKVTTLCTKIQKSVSNCEQLLANFSVEENSDTTNEYILGIFTELLWQATVAITVCETVLRITHQLLDGISRNASESSDSKHTATQRSLMVLEMITRNITLQRQLEDTTNGYLKDLRDTYTGPARNIDKYVAMEETPVEEGRRINLLGDVGTGVSPEQQLHTDFDEPYTHFYSGESADELSDITMPELLTVPHALSFADTSKTREQVTNRLHDMLVSHTHTVGDMAPLGSDSDVNDSITRVCDICVKLCDIITTSNFPSSVQQQAERLKTQMTTTSNIASQHDGKLNLIEDITYTALQCMCNTIGQVMCKKIELHVHGNSNNDVTVNIRGYVEYFADISTSTDNPPSKRALRITRWNSVIHGLISSIGRLGHDSYREYAIDFEASEFGSDTSDRKSSLYVPEKIASYPSGLQPALQIVYDQMLSLTSAVQFKILAALYIAEDRIRVNAKQIRHISSWYVADDVASFEHDTTSIDDTISSVEVMVPLTWNENNSLDVISNFGGYPMVKDYATEKPLSWWTLLTLCNTNAQMIHEVPRAEVWNTLPPADPTEYQSVCDTLLELRKHATDIGKFTMPITNKAGSLQYTKNKAPIIQLFTTFDKYRDEHTSLDTMQRINIAIMLKTILITFVTNARYLNSGDYSYGLNIKSYTMTPSLVRWNMLLVYNEFWNVPTNQMAIGKDRSPVTVQLEDYIWVIMLRSRLDELTNSVPSKDWPTVDMKAEYTNFMNWAYVFEGRNENAKFGLYRGVIAGKADLDITVLHNAVTVLRDVAKSPNDITVNTRLKDAIMETDAQLNSARSNPESTNIDMLGYALEVLTGASNSDHNFLRDAADSISAYLEPKNMVVV